LSPRGEVVTQGWSCHPGGKLALRGEVGTQGWSWHPVMKTLYSTLRPSTFSLLMYVIVHITWLRLERTCWIEVLILCMDMLNSALCISKSQPCLTTYVK
jgi:hypothetical protein